MPGARCDTGRLSLLPGTPVLLGSDSAENQADRLWRTRYTAHGQQRLTRVIRTAYVLARHLGAGQQLSLWLQQRCRHAAASELAAADLYVTKHVSMGEYNTFVDELCSKVDSAVAYVQQRLHTPM